MIKLSRLPALTLATLLAALLATTVPAAAETTELDQRVQGATEVLKDLQRIPEQAIPPNLLNRSYAVAVIPNVVKGGFIVGGSYGKGVLLVRQADGSWSNPAFVKLGNVGIGWQAGVQGADLVLVFRSKAGVDNIARGKFTLGGSASASAGPVGRTAQAMTDGEFKSEIYTYARSRGLFAGVSIDGGAITIDKEANTAWYGESNSAAARLFSDPTIPAPPSAQTLIATLSEMAPKLEWKSEAQAAGAPAASGAAPASDVPASNGARTYGVDENAPPAPETQF